MSKFRDLDAFDHVLDEHFSSDKNIKTGLATALRWQDPEHRADRIKKQREGLNQPEVIAKLKAAGSKPKGAAHAEKNRVANLGKKKTDEAKQKIAQAQIGNRKHCKAVMTPHGRFESMKEAAEALNMRGETIRARTRHYDFCKEWYIIDQDSHDKTLAPPTPNKVIKPIVTPEGAFPRFVDARNYYIEKGLVTKGSAIGWFYRQLERDPTNYYYITVEEYEALE
jgi:hypothetical protein